MRYRFIHNHRLKCEIDSGHWRESHFRAGAVECYALRLKGVWTSVAHDAYGSGIIYYEDVELDVPPEFVLACDKTWESL